MKILYYCQHVLGIGHFFRSMEVARAFANHRVLFVEGGDPLPGYRSPQHVRRAFLPALMMDADFARMETHGRDLEGIERERRQKLLGLFSDYRPDVLIIELFPFGRKRFGFELIPLLERATSAGQTLVVCSLRDILVEKDDPQRYESKVLDILNRYFHLLLVHSDPRLIRLEETFSRTADILVPLHYTGYVARPPGPRDRPRDFRRIVVSGGGGRVGTELFATAIEAFALLPDPDLSLILFAGPFISAADRDRISAMARKDRRVTFTSFSADFAGELLRSRVSISMAGYNTCMDLVQTGVGAIVHPFAQNREQSLRAARFQSRGLLKVIDRLDPHHLARLIDSILTEPTAGQTAPADIDLDGARRSVEIVEKYLENNYVN